LQEYDKDNVPAEVIEGVQPFLANPEFNPERVMKASKVRTSVTVLVDHRTHVPHVRPRERANLHWERWLSTTCLDLPLHVWFTCSSVFTC